jgi:hypothetical protein
MFLHFVSFEIRYWLRSWMLWIFLFIIALLIFGATATDQVTVGGALENTLRNAPFVIENYYSFICLLTLLMTVAFVNSAASRDFAFNTHQMIFATPLRKFDYLAGRYLGSTLIAVIPLLGVSVGIIVGKWMPWIDAERWGPVNWPAHTEGILVFAIPNTFFIAAIIFAIAVLTRSTVTSFIGGLFLLTAYGVGQALTSDIRHETAAALLDPFAIRTFGLATKYWTVAEKNTATIGYGDHLLLLNRLIWISAGVLIFAFAYYRFRFEERASQKKPRQTEAEVSASTPLAPATLHETFGFAAQVSQSFGTLKVEFFGLVKSTAFIVITVAALLNCVPSLTLSNTEGYGNTFFPVTYRLIEVIQGTLYFFLLGMITFYAGVLVWKERDSGMDEIHDALPNRNWPIYAAKLVALLFSVFLIVCAAGASGVITQFFLGYHHYQFGLWAEELLGMDFTIFIFFTILAFFIHVVSPNKYIGYFAFIAFAIVNSFAWRPLNVSTNLVQFASRPGTTYSDFFGFAPYWQSWGWFTLYWFAFCAILAVASVALWQRGREREWKFRWREAGERFRGGLRAAALASLVAFVASGAWIFYNTKILNTVLGEDDRDKLAVDYEKTYKKYEHLAQPRIIDVNYAIDIYPERRAATMHGDEIIQNETASPISLLHLTYADPDYSTQVAVDGATLKRDDARLRYQIYNFHPPLQPGEQRHLRFTVTRAPQGFENSPSVLQVVENGTFFNNIVAPQIGYQGNRELNNKNKRKKYGLKEKDLMPTLERNCTADCLNTYISNNSDWVNVHTIISTSPGQIAIAPGSLEREWTEKGRRHF